MKTTLLTMLTFFIAVSAFARPVPSPEQMCENYKTCLNESDTFYFRWGQYLAGFSYKEASKKCVEQNTSGYSSPRLMGCRTSQGWLAAGYYCENFPY